MMVEDEMNLIRDKQLKDHYSGKEIHEICLTCEAIVSNRLKIVGRVWCCRCDVNMLKEGVAMDCPTDGVFYYCLRCNARIVIFEKEEERE